MRKQQSGFTLIELVMVIVILGILAAFALPRFADLSVDARRATLEGAEASIRSASAIAHSAQLAGNLAAGASVTIEGVAITMANRYPTTNDDGDAATAATPNGIIVAAQVSPTDYTITPGATSVTVSPIGATTAANCVVTYNAAVTPPAITVVNTGC